MDKPTARQLADDLTALGHEPWLDEYAIRVGDSIPGRIEEGLHDADFVVVLLSPAAVASGWVDREWKAKYWDEVTSGKTMVLPALLQDCDVPQLLKPKRYANFRNYAVGLVELAAAIAPVGPALSGISPPPTVPTQPGSDDVSALIAKVQSRAVPLAQCFAEALGLAIARGQRDLEAFCRAELGGLPKDGDPSSAPKYRMIEMFLSPELLNMNYMGWGGSASAALDYMRRTKGYVPFSMVVVESVGQIEAGPPVDPAKNILTISMPWSSVQADAPQPDATIYGYAPGDSYSRVLESIRAELTGKLLVLLPSVKEPSGES